MVQAEKNTYFALRFVIQYNPKLFSFFNKGDHMKLFSTITLCLLICVAFSHADLMEGLVLYMPLDEGSGTATQDLSANGFEGELKGNAKWIDGKFGMALQFAAAADHVVVEDDAAFHIEGAITQAALGTAGSASKRTRHYLRHPTRRCNPTYRLWIRYESSERYQSLDQRCSRWIQRHQRQ